MKQSPFIYDVTVSSKASTNQENGEDWLKILPLDSNGGQRVWRWGKESVKLKAKTEIVIKDKDGQLNVFAKDKIKEGRKPKTVWVDPKYDASSHGTILLQKI